MHQVQHYYDMCCRYRGKRVRITDVSGKEYRGRIVDVDQQYVYLEQESSGFGGFGYGYRGYYGHYGYYRPVFPIALAAIGGFALGAAFFW
ncbi:hypothetical protein [Salipaludibacillus daqingensis]|uniref:hypothetical protein n=1 Tax=Salipaludibacillus daqingensis TaxID=3041001 RepID=UPI0024737F09|nr:hypothetical protein [Salipaludibacillus daqingensis]